MQMDVVLEGRKAAAQDVRWEVDVDGDQMGDLQHQCSASGVSAVGSVPLLDPPMMPVTLHSVRLRIAEIMQAASQDIVYECESLLAHTEHSFSVLPTHSFHKEALPRIRVTQVVDKEPTTPQRSRHWSAYVTKGSGSDHYDGTRSGNSLGTSAAPGSSVSGVPGGRGFESLTSPHARRFRLLPELMPRGEEGEEVLTLGETLTIDQAASQPHSTFETGKRGWMQHPSSAGRLIWDMLSVICLGYDVVLFPLAVFDYPESDFTFAMAAVLIAYWTTDILMSFSCGYYLPDGSVELRMCKVARRYSMTWLMPDLIIVSLDWVSFAQRIAAASVRSKGSQGIARLAKVSRVFRLMGLVRLLRIRRVVKVQRVLHNLMGMECTAIVATLCRNLVLILLLTHLIATVWYGIGNSCEDAGWLRDLKSDYWFHNYLMSLHWSIANFTPGSSGIQPVTTSEYGFQVVVLFFALVVFSVFVSSTTSLITKLMGLHSSQSYKLRQLNTFLRQNYFPLEFRDRVDRWVHHTLESEHAQIRQEDVELLNLLSKPLREEVRAYVHLKTLHGHSFMKLVSSANKSLIRKVSNEAAESTSFAKGDVIFTFGESIDRMGFVVSGKLLYQRRWNPCETTSDGGGSKLIARDWFCEVALWTKWHGCGTMEAEEDCQLLEVNASTFRNIVLSNRIMAKFARLYAEAVVDDLNALAQADVATYSESLDDLIDLYHTGEAVQRVLDENTSSSMPGSFMSYSTLSQNMGPMQVAVRNSMRRGKTLNLDNF
mmetsp:Transcript_54410/g.126995  ORF Transcript_54410/g.126995 Transcript_54410/m.126995 type:complete len:768 (+) Transcript_54410:89-2392(+)